ncbi:MAG: hypothetical protein MN733_08540 [Nitrososphaera sp.]|nr:hypothetical protein [Nitrososphaera sp.]
MSPHKVYVFLAGTLLVWMSWSAFYFPLFEYSPHEDFWDHAPAIKEWSEDLLNPANPHIVSDAGTVRYTPFSLLFVAISRLLNITAIDSLEVAAVFNTLLFVVGTFVFLQAYFRRPWAPVIGLVVFVAFWGMGYRHANEFQLRTLFYVAPYPSTFAFGVGLVSLFLTLKIIRSEVTTGWSAVLLFVLLVSSVLSHVLTSVFIIAGLGLLCITEPGVRKQLRAIPILATIAALTLAELWPFFSVREIVFGTDGHLQEGISWLEKQTFSVAPYVYDLSRVVLALGPALLGLPCILYLALRRHHLFIVYGFLLMAAPYAISFFWNIPEANRFLFFAVFFLHMALVWAVLRIAAFNESMAGGQAAVKQKVLLGLVGVAFWGSVVWNLSYAGAHFGYTYFRKESVPLVMERVSAFLSEDSVVLAPLRIGYPIPSFKGKIVGLMHHHPMVPDDRQRVRDVMVFFEAGTSDEQRLNIIKKYKVTHVLFESQDVSDEVRQFLLKEGLSLGSVAGYCYEGNVNEVIRDWENLFRACRKSMLEGFKVGKWSV